MNKKTPFGNDLSYKGVFLCTEMVEVRSKKE